MGRSLRNCLQSVLNDECRGCERMSPSGGSLSSRLGWVAMTCSASPTQASTFQMAILLQYNTEDMYTVQQLADSTQIKTVRRCTSATLRGRALTAPPTAEITPLFHLDMFPEMLFYNCQYLSKVLKLFFFSFHFQDILVQVLQILLKSKLLVSALNVS